MKFNKVLSSLGWVMFGGVIVFSLFQFGQKIGQSGSARVVDPLIKEAVAAEIGSDGVQRITLAFGQFNYTPDVIRVKSGKPVEIKADGSLRGCFSTFVVPELNVWGKFSGPGSKVSFTPKNEGKFRFSCAMGMGAGTLIVES